MAKDESKRITPPVLDGDRTAFAALQAITTYTTANPAFTLAAITSAHAQLAAAQSEEAQTSAAAAAARDTAVAREWEFHNLMLGAKDQVTAQYGRDSAEVQALGLKRTSEYKTRARKASKGDPQK